MTTSDRQGEGVLPWLERDHQRILTLVESIVSASRRSATQFVVHRFLEELRSLCGWHFDRCQHALSRAGLEHDHCRESTELLDRIFAIQRSLRLGQGLDDGEFIDYLRAWSRQHVERCSAELTAAAAAASRDTRWDLLHTDALYPLKIRNSIPPDPQTSGSFMV